MSNTYKILYRHMKIETPAPNSETYDCWVDGEANTVSVQLQGEYGPTGPIETMPLDDDVMLSRFGAAICTVIASLSTTIESDETEKADKNPRNTQFAGFGKLVVQRMLASKQGGYIDFNSDDAEDIEDYSKIVAQCAHEFASHTASFVSVREVHLMHAGILSPRQVADQVPDMTEWPEETSK